MLSRPTASVLALLVVAGALSGCAIRETAAQSDAVPTAAPRAVPSPSPTAAAEAPVPAPSPVPAPAPVEAQPEAQAGVTSLSAQPISGSVEAQVNYMLTYWSDYNDAYGVVVDNDCVNFTSQSLLARGWVEDSTWYFNASNIYNSAPAWVSSTAFRNYLKTRSDTIALNDSQRDQVAVGDIAQFDWDNSGDRDHTGVVTRVENTASGIKIYFAGHTLDSDYRSVDDAITVDHPGGTAYYFHITS
jgi:hypothetical protein